MDRKEFWHILKTCHGYQTKDRPRLRVERIPGGATAFYYLRLADIFYRHSFIAERGNYMGNPWADGCVQIKNTVESVGGRLCISGLENISGYRGPLVYISNHMSMIDAFFLPPVLVMYNNVTFVIKTGLLHYPVFGKIMRAVHPIAVNRKNPREDLKKVLSEGTRLLSRGWSVIVFPQATRSRIFDGEAFNTLGVKLARRANVPVVPVALKTDFQDHGTWFRDLGWIRPERTIYMRFGPVINTGGSGADIHEQVVSFIVENLRSWGAEVRNV